MGAGASATWSKTKKKTQQHLSSSITLPKNLTAFELNESTCIAHWAIYSFPIPSAISLQRKGTKEKLYDDNCMMCVKEQEGEKQSSNF